MQSKILLVMTALVLVLSRPLACDSFAAESVVADKENAAKEGQQIWEGSLNVGVAVLRLRFEISRDDDGEFSGHMISVDQGNAKIPLTDMSVDGDNVMMEFKSIDSTFTGKRSKGKEEIVGKWKQLGKTYDYTIKRAEPETPKTHTETWAGIMMAGKTEFDFQLRIEVDEQGKQHALLDSFTEQRLDLSTEFDSTEDGFTFRLPVIKASFTGKYNDDRTEVKGEWDQVGKLPLALKKIPIAETRWSLEKPKRPQHPTEPFPYAVKEVAFSNKADGIKFAGTLTIPKSDETVDGKKRFPAVILVSGSGPQDRDETLFDHKPFLVVADHLTRKGIAVLRYDERGVGDSSGKFVGATTADFARDAESGIDFLLKHESIDPAKIGIIGHSEGGVIAPMIAARRDDVAFVVMLAGPGVTGAEISTSQSRAMSAAAGLPAAYLDTQEEALSGVIKRIKEERKPLTEEQIDEVLDKIAAEEGKQSHISLMAAAMKNLTDPWMTTYILSDPAPDLRKVTCPVLALYGEKDLQVLPKLNLEAVKKHLTAAGNKDFKTVELPGLNHLFQTAESGQMTEYGRIEETFAPVALEAMSEWIIKRI